MGFEGYDCSQVTPTIQPPPIRRTASPPENTPPSADKSHSTPTNTYIRKSNRICPTQVKFHSEKRHMQIARFYHFHRSALEQTVIRYVR